MEEKEDEKPPEDPEFGEDEPECAGAFGIMPALGHLFQDDLNEFYLNPVIKVFYWYAWFFTNLMVYLTYGGGMPLMYPLGILFFILNFYVEKFLFCCFHRKTFGFDESLPNRSVKLMKWGIFLHLLMRLLHVKISIPLKSENGYGKDPIQQLNYNIFLVPNCRQSYISKVT